MMKKLLAMLLFISIAICPALAEDVAVEGDAQTEDTLVFDVAENGDILTPLPIDFSAGPEPDPGAFTESSYQDASLTVTMEQVWVNDARFNVARVTIADPSQLRTSLSCDYGKKRTALISTMAKGVNAVVAIGGDYYMDRTKGYIVRQGNVYRTTLFKTLDILLVDQNADFHIIKAGDADSLAALLESGVQPVNVFNFGPALVVDGEQQEISKKYDFNPTGKEPRCAIGQTGPLEYMLVVVDGRKAADSAGCTVETLATFMKDQGCIQAYALDGGNSALMVFGDKNYSAKSHSAERDVSDIIYFATLVDGAAE